MWTFSSFVDFPFVFWRVSFDGGFPFFLNFFFLNFILNLCIGCQLKVSKCIFLSPLVGLDIFLVELARTEVSSEETVPSIYQGST